MCKRELQKVEQRLKDIKKELEKEKRGRLVYKGKRVEMFAAHVSQAEPETHLYYQIAIDGVFIGGEVKHENNRWIYVKPSEKSRAHFLSNLQLKSKRS